MLTFFCKNGKFLAKECNFLVKIGKFLVKNDIFKGGCQRD